MVFEKNGLKVNFQPMFFSTQNCSCINLFHKFIKTKEQFAQFVMKLNFVQFPPVLRKYPARCTQFSQLLTNGFYKY